MNGEFSNKIVLINESCIWVGGFVNRANWWSYNNENAGNAQTVNGWRYRRKVN